MILVLSLIPITFAINLLHHIGLARHTAHTLQCVDLSIDLSYTSNIFLALHAFCCRRTPTCTLSHIGIACFIGYVVFLNPLVGCPRITLQSITNVPQNIHNLDYHSQAKPEVIIERRAIWHFSGS
jgi:hypothetical protein